MMNLLGKKTVTATVFNALSSFYYHITKNTKRFFSSVCWMAHFCTYLDISVKTLPDIVHCRLQIHSRSWRGHDTNLHLRSWLFHKYFLSILLCVIVLYIHISFFTLICKSKLVKQKSVLLFVSSLFFFLLTMGVGCGGANFCTHL